MLIYNMGGGEMSGWIYSVVTVSVKIQNDFLVVFERKIV
jgi:hypothetical protein